MNEINKLLAVSHDNRNLLQLISQKQDHLFKRLDELEGRFFASKVQDGQSTPPPSDTETFKVENNYKESQPRKIARHLSFSDDSSSGSDDGASEFKDAVQIPPIFKLDEKEVTRKEEIFFKNEEYSGSIYYSNSQGKCKRISSIKCTFKKGHTDVIFDIKSTGDSSTTVDLQLICGLEKKGMYDLEVKDKYSIIKAKPGAFLYISPEVRLVLLKFHDKAVASSIFNRISNN
uniref:Uncharacterized protein n=1 Tax=Strongyloides stercoralis TaxID=6248 RepID=A0A0K0EN00_STRER